MLATMHIVPGCTSFNLNNGAKLDLMVYMKSLEGFSFDECVAMANKADIDDIVVPFFQINHLIAYKKLLPPP